MQLVLQVDAEYRRQQDFIDMKMTMQLNMNLLIEDAKDNQEELKQLLHSIMQQQSLVDKTLVAMGHHPLSNDELVEMDRWRRDFSIAIDSKLNSIIDEVHKVNGVVVNVQQQVLLISNKLDESFSHEEKEKARHHKQAMAQKLDISHMRSDIHVIGKQIGEGGFGIVRLAVRISSPESRYAVKVFKGVSPSGRICVENEALIMQLLAKNQNTVDCFGYIHHLDESWIVMEFAAYGSIGKILNNQELFHVIPFYVKFLWMRDSMAGLTYMHNLRIIHKDFKPDNLLVFLDLKVKLCDFGLSKELEEEQSKTEGKEPGGTTLYMAPEQRDNRGSSDRSDVYSWGITALQIMWGKNLVMIH